MTGVIDSLKGAKAPYMMIGAWALSVWGRPRATMDLDFLVMVDGNGLDRLERHLLQEGFSSVETWLEWNPMLKDMQRRMHFDGIAVGPSGAWKRLIEAGAANANGKEVIKVIVPKCVGDPIPARNEKYLPPKGKLSFE